MQIVKFQLSFQLLVSYNACSCGHRLNCALEFGNKLIITDHQFDSCLRILSVFFLSVVHVHANIYASADWSRYTSFLLLLRGWLTKFCPKRYNIRSRKLSLLNLSEVFATFSQFQGRHTILPSIFSRDCSLL